MKDVQFPTGPSVGKIKYRTDAREEYINHAVNAVAVDLTGMKIVVDCAEGASHYTLSLIHIYNKDLNSMASLL